MRNIYFLFISFILLCGFSACKKEGTGVNPNVQPGLIIGTWNLQQQKIVQYVNGAKQTDTTYTTANTNSLISISRAHFNSNGTFYSVSYLITGMEGNNLSGGAGTAVARDSTSGNYTILSSNLNLTAPVAGFGNIAAFYGVSATATQIPAFNLLSRSSVINLLTFSKLTIHTELNYTATTGADTKTYKEEQDFYYSR